jgi:hypothetical protein
LKMCTATVRANWILIDDVRRHRSLFSALPIQPVHLLALLGGRLRRDGCKL